MVYESVYTVDFGEQCGWSFNGGITKKTKSGIKLFRGRSSI